MNTNEWFNKMQEERKTDARIDRIVNSTSSIDKEINLLKQENSKLAEDNKRLVEELKKQNEVINSLKQPKWHQWITWLLAAFAAIASLISCLI